MSTSSKSPNTIRQGGPGASHENAKAPLEAYLNWLKLRRTERPVDGIVLTEHRQFNKNADYRALEDKFGILVLKASLTGLPTNLAGLLSVISPSQCFAHHFGITITPVAIRTTARRAHGLRMGMALPMAKPFSSRLTIGSPPLPSRM